MSVLVTVMAYKNNFTADVAFRIPVDLYLCYYYKTNTLMNIPSCKRFVFMLVVITTSIQIYLSGLSITPVRHIEISQ